MGIIQGIQEIIRRVETIQIADGYSIDLLGKVMVDEDSIDYETLPIAMLFTGECSEVSRGGHVIRWQRELFLDVIVPVDPRDVNEWMKTELLMSDVHRALLAGELNRNCINSQKNLAGTVKSFEITAAVFSNREDGFRVKGVSCDLRVEYITDYAKHDIA